MLVILVAWMNEWTVEMYMEMLLRNILYSLQHCIVPRDYLEVNRKQHLLLTHSNILWTTSGEAAYSRSQHFLFLLCMQLDAMWLQLWLWNSQGCLQCHSLQHWQAKSQIAFTCTSLSHSYAVDISKHCAHALRLILHGAVHCCICTFW